MIIREDYYGWDFKAISSMLREDPETFKQLLNQKRPVDNDTASMKMLCLKSFLNTLQNQDEQERSLVFAKAFLMVAPA